MTVNLPHSDQTVNTLFMPIQILSVSMYEQDMVYMYNRVLMW